MLEKLLLLLPVYAKGLLHEKLLLLLLKGLLLLLLLQGLLGLGLLLLLLGLGLGLGLRALSHGSLGEQGSTRCYCCCCCCARGGGSLALRQGCRCRGCRGLGHWGCAGTDPAAAAA